MILTLLAAAADVTPVGPDATVDSAFDLTPYTVTLILGFVIPLVNGLVTKYTTPAWVKAVVGLVLAAVAGVINVSLTEGGGAVISQSTLKSAGLTFIVAVAAYAGVWKPFSLTSSPVTHVDETGVLVTEPGKLSTVGVK